MKKIFLILIVILTMGIHSCKEAFVGQQPVEFVAPDTVTNVTYESLPGAVRLTYNLPLDKDLMAVKATYTLDNGTKMEAAASAFKNTLLIEGFGKGDSLRTVEIVCVDLSQNVSKKVTVKVEPLESPIYNIKKSLVAGVDFGGIYLKWKNPLNSDIIVVVTTPDKAGKPEVTIGGKFYSKIDSAVVNVRGYDTIPRNFYIQVFDRWGNKSKMDTLNQIKPLFEEMIPKTNFQKWNPTDIPYQEYSGSFGIALTWNGKWGSVAGANDCYSTASGGNTTNSITYDLNKLANPATGKGFILPSRVRIHARYTHNYTAIPKEVRIYGSTSPNVLTTNTEGSDAWILLSPENGFLMAPPSGMSGLTPTAADKTFIEEDGIDLIFGPGKPPIRYVRIECASKWNTTTSLKSFTYAEITWYGQVVR